MVLVKLKDSTVEIKDVDDLYRVVKELRSRDEPLVLQDNGKEIIVPTSNRPKRRRTSPEERARANEEAFFSALGSWKDRIDPEEFMRQVYEARGHRPQQMDRLPSEDRQPGVASSVDDL